MTNDETEKLVDALWGATFMGSNATIDQREECKARYRDILNDSLRAELAAANARADMAWNEAIEAAAYIPHANASNSRKELRYETEKFCIGIRDEIIRLKRPTQSKPEPTVGPFKVGDWVTRKRDYQTADWIWGDEPCEIMRIRENTINLKIHGVSRDETWGFSFFTLAPTAEQPLDEPVIMPAWDDLPKEQKKDDGIDLTGINSITHWVSPNGAFIDEQSYTFVRNALQSLQKSKGAAAPMPDKEKL